GTAMDNDTDSIARTIFGEARGEGKHGMQAIANTIMNRVAKKSWYGLTPYEVCHKPWQYSCWNAADPNCQIINDVDNTVPVFCDALQIAGNAISGGLDDITGGATHYYNKHMAQPPEWAEGKTPCASIGSHLFFNNIG